MTCVCLFLFVFLYAPLLTFLFGLGHLWIGFLSYLVLSSGAILWLFRRSWRELYPGDSEGYVQHMFTIALSPFAAIRANDVIIRDILSDFHPLAVARRILSENEWLQFANTELRKIKFLYDDGVLLKCLMEFLIQQEVDVNALLCDPVPASPITRTFRPVCLTQYVIEVGVCRDCDDIQLHSFPQHSLNQ